MSVKNTIAAIVVTYNRKVLLEECLNALLNQSHAIDTIFIIDNGSNDGTYDFLEEKGFIANPVIKYKNLGENLGGAGGFHFGLKEAFEHKFDWYWMMDDDSISSSDALENLVLSDAFKRDDVGVLNSKIVDVTGRFLKTQKLYNFKNGRETLITAEKVQDKNEIPVDTSSFVGFFVKHAVVEKVGLPRKEFFIQKDDDFYSILVRKAGYFNYLITESVIIHKISILIDAKNKATLTEFWKIYYGFRNNIYFNLHLIDSNSNKAVYIFRTGVTFTKYFLKNLYLDHSSMRNQVLIQAYYDGFRGNLGKSIDPAEYREKCRKLEKKDK